MKNSTVVKGLLLKLVIPYKKIAITKLYRDFFIFFSATTSLYRWLSAVDSSLSAYSTRQINTAKTVDIKVEIRLMIMGATNFFLPLTEEKYTAPT